MTIEEFIEVRIAEDEQQAREATDDGHNWLVEEESISIDATRCARSCAISRRSTSSIPMRPA